MINRAQLAQQAMREASRLRTANGISLADSICPYDVADALGLSVQFLAVPSLEGIYEAGRGAIFIGSERPSGRRRFTCAHELGHHVFKHGTSFDQIRTAHTDSSNQDEVLADAFAASLLMPKTAIDAALSRRRWARRPFTAEMIFTLSQDLGVGFEAMLTHLNLVLRYVSGALRTQLERRKLRDIREEIAGFDVPYDVFPADEHWGARPVDLEVGDVLITSASVIDGNSVEAEPAPKHHLVGARPGVTKLRLPTGRELTARVMSREYSGRASNRFEEEAGETDDE